MPYLIGKIYAAKHIPSERLQDIDVFRLRCCPSGLFLILLIHWRGQLRFFADANPNSVDVWNESGYGQRQRAAHNRFIIVGRIRLFNYQFDDAIALRILHSAFRLSTVYHLWVGKEFEVNRQNRFKAALRVSAGKPFNQQLRYFGLCASFRIAYFRVACRKQRAFRIGKVERCHLRDILCILRDSRTAFSLIKRLIRPLHVS